MTPRVAGAVARASLGVIVTIAVVTYFIWVFTFPEPVDWLITMQIALYFAPFVAVGGAWAGDVR